MKQILGPKYVKKAGQWVITILTIGKTTSQENRFFDTEEQANDEIKMEKLKI